MFVMAALLAVSLAPQDTPEPSRVGYKVNVYEMSGLQWRAMLHNKLQPIENQGAATVWIAPKDAIASVSEQSDSILFSPKPTTGREVPAEMQTSLVRSYVAHLERVADGPHGQATALTYNPQVERVEEWLNVAIECYKAEEGILASVAIDEMRLARMYTYPIHEALKTTAADGSNAAQPRVLTATIQVPEMVQGGAEGEWLIPPGHVLLVGLGVHHTQLGDGPAELLERVAVIEPNETPATTAAPTPSARQALVTPTRDLAMSRTTATPVAITQPAAPVPFVGLAGAALTTQPIVLSAQPNATVIVVVPGGAPVIPNPLPVANRVDLVAAASYAPAVIPPAPIAASALTAAPAAMLPPVPQRMLPTPINHEGKVVPLPPLPDPEPADENESAEPRGSSQTPHVKLNSAAVIPSCPSAPIDPKSHAITELVSHELLSYARRQNSDDQPLPRSVFEFRTQDPQGKVDGYFRVWVSSNKAGRDCLLKNHETLAKAEPATSAPAPHDAQTAKVAHEELNTAPAAQAPAAPAPSGPRGRISFGVSTGSPAFRFPLAPQCAIEIDVKVENAPKR